MSKSRLEKFLYALYSLDSSDLPNPLSRIEELYKCLVTGDKAPTFEPLSRVEKYLMAILGVYDADELPNPISRVEVLLYKLATGDDNLDDVKSFLSEHEELLAEIIRNGGVGGNIDIEYVLYTLSTEYNTLYNTAEKPVKSAILKGNTIKKIGLESGSYNGYLEKIPMNNRLRTTEHVNGYNIIRVDCKDGYQAFIRTGAKDSSWNQSLSITLESERSFVVLFKKNDESVFSQSDYDNVIEYTNIAEISDNNGNELVSVKMPVLTTMGKQLLNVNDLSNIITTDGTIPTLPTIINAAEGIIQINETSRENYKGYKVKVKPNTDYIGSCLSLSGERIRCRILDLQGNKLNSQVDHSPRIVYSFNSGDNDYVVVAFTCHTTDKEEVQIALYEGTTQPTSYEPYKSNILTVNEDVELRGICDVKDELDLVTGEFTQRIGEVVLDGSENCSDADNALSNTHRFQVSLSTFKTGGILLNDGGFDNITSGTSNTDTKNIQISGGYVFIRTLRNEVDSLDDFKSFLSSNPLTIIGELAVGTTSKTVDLSVVDQAGNDTELSTFDDITHVALSSEGFIPVAELEVATKNKEVLNTMSLEMDDIFTTQNALKETSNTQSENVDATMIATTEIYEGLL